MNDATIAAGVLGPGSKYRGSQWTPEKDGALQALWRRGDATAAIASALGTTKGAVVGRARVLKLQQRKNHAPPKKELSQEKIEAITALRQQGISWELIAEQVGVSRLVLVRIARERGLPRGRARRLSRHAKQGNKWRRQQGPSHVPLPPKFAAEAGPPRRGPIPIPDPKRCNWPIGDPRVDGFRWCGEPTDRFPYCDRHRMLSCSSED